MDEQDAGTPRRKVTTNKSAAAAAVPLLIALPPTRRDPELSTLARESVIATVTTEKPAAGADDHAGRPGQRGRADRRHQDRRRGAGLERGSITWTQT